MYFIYLTSRITDGGRQEEKEREEERERKRSFICWFTAQMAVMVGLG